MSIHLRRDLETLHEHILFMCAKVKDLVTDAVEELKNPDATVSEAIADRDDEIDRWDVEVEEECLRILALHQPVAEDLRRVVAVMKIGWELERVADLAVNIAERAAGLVGVPGVVIPSRLDQMTKMSVGMLWNALDAFVSKNNRLARAVCQQDDFVDIMNREIIDELVQLMKRSPDLVEPSLHLFSVSRHIESVADHATNIAEDVVYLVEGEIIRHHAELWRAG
jgi:phosphate transport system protein